MESKAPRDMAYIRTMLADSGSIEEPHYSDIEYQRGDYFESGFLVVERPPEPIPEFIHLGLAVEIDATDNEPHYMRNKAEESAEVIHLGQTITYLKPTDPPYSISEYAETEYSDMECAERERVAEAIARAVKSAVLRGEIDPSTFA